MVQLTRPVVVILFLLSVGISATRGLKHPSNVVGGHAKGAAGMLTGHARKGVVTLKVKRV